MSVLIKCGSGLWSAIPQQVFAGMLQSAIDPHGRLSLAEAETMRRVPRRKMCSPVRTEVGRVGSTSVAADCPAANGNGSCWHECSGSTQILILVDPTSCRRAYRGTDR